MSKRDKRSPEGAFSRREAKKIAATINEGSKLTDELRPSVEAIAEPHPNTGNPAFAISRIPDADSIVLNQQDFDTMRTSVALMLMEMDNIRILMLKRQDILRIAVTIIESEQHVLREVRKLAKLVGVEL